ncbi:MAG: flippase [Planctomycetota bacterium]
MKHSQKKTIVLNTVALFASQGWIVVLSLLVLPYIVNSLGKEPYALLSLSFVVVGYMGFLDLGLGSALTKFISEYHAKGDSAKINSIVTTSLTIFLIMGCVGGTSLFLLSQFLVENVFKVTAEFKNTALHVLYITSIGLSFVLLKNYSNAIPSGFQRITIVSGCDAFFNSLKLLLTIALIFLGYGIFEIVFGSVVLTLLGAITVIIFTKKAYPSLSIRPGFDKGVALELLRYGMPLSLAAVTSNAIIHLDKFMITVFLPFTSLAYYTVAYDISSRLWYIPNNIMRAFFPVFSKYHAMRDKERLKKYYLSAFKYVVIGSTFVAVLLAAFGNEILQYWINPDYAVHGRVTLQILAIGLLMSCYACVPFSLVTACGFSRVVAKVHILIAVINLALCVLLIPLVGIEGAAFAWLIEHIIDLLILLHVVKARIVSVGLTEYVKKIFARPVFLSCILVLAGKYISICFLSSLGDLLIVCLVLSAGYLLLGYVFLLNKDERQVVTIGLSNAFGKLRFCQ